MYTTGDAALPTRALAGGAAAGMSAGGLATTGFPILAFVVAGVVLILGGLLLVRAAHLRRVRTPHQP